MLFHSVFSSSTRSAALAKSLPFFLFTLFFIKIKQAIHEQNNSLVTGGFTNGLGSKGGNTGTWLYSEIYYSGSSTGAHEYGHSLGELSPADGGNGGNHPTETDIRNESDAPGIMYAKGAAVAGPYTYDPLKGATQLIRRIII